MRFITFTCQFLTLCPDGSEFETFLGPVVVIFPQNATENVGFLKTFKIWVFDQKEWFFSNQTYKFSKLPKVANVHSNAYQMVLFRTNVFSAIMRRLFLQKIRNFLLMGKVEKMTEDDCVLIYSKAFFTKMGRPKIWRW